MSNLKPVMFWDTSSSGHYRLRSGKIVRGGQWRFGLAGEAGRKYTPVVFNNGTGVKVAKIDNDDKKAMRAEPVKSPAKAVKRMLAQGRTFGITKEAKRMLREMAA